MADGSRQELLAAAGVEILLTLDELAMFAGQSRRTIERAVARGEITVRRFGPRLVRVSADEAARYLRAASVEGSRSRAQEETSG